MNICVYGASSDDIRPVYLERAEQLGALLAEKGMGLVFGGGLHGVMGAAYRGAKAKNGVIIGVAPRFFDQPGILAPGVTELCFTDTMRERKSIMEERADGFIMAPGGVGTYDEFFEILTLKHLDRHQKPIAVLNIDHCYDGLEALLAGMQEQGFLRREVSALCTFCTTPEEAVALMAAEMGED